MIAHADIAWFYIQMEISSVVEAAEALETVNEATFGP
jgi:hypothetical protein